MSVVAVYKGCKSRGTPLKFHIKPHFKQICWSYFYAILMTFLRMSFCILNWHAIDYICQVTATTDIYIYSSNLQFLNNDIIIKTKVLVPHDIVNFIRFWLLYLCPLIYLFIKKTFELVCFPIFWHALNYISPFLSQNNVLSSLMDNLQILAI
jgi:hypothetical protein